MKLNWSRGFFRAWAVVAVAWVCITGWALYANKNPMDWEKIRAGDDCWARLAKWPDGRPFEGNNIWEIVDEFNVPSNIELNKRDNAWKAESIPERNKWRAAIRQKLSDCEADAEAALPITQRLKMAAHNWLDLKVVLLPPIALLLAGWIFGWIMRGFRVVS